MPNFSSLAGLEVAEKFLWGVGGWGGVVCTVIFMSNPTVVLSCAGVGVLTILELAVPVWHSRLTKQQLEDKRYPLNLFLVSNMRILNKGVQNFVSSLHLCIKEQYKAMVKPGKECKCRTKRFQKSSLSYFAKLLNTAPRHKKTGK